MAHVAPATIHTMVRRNVVDGITLPTSPKVRSPCSGCLLGKSVHSPFPSSSSSSAASLFDLVHAYVPGPLSVPLISGATYFVSFHDDSSRWEVIYHGPETRDIRNFQMLAITGGATHRTSDPGPQDGQRRIIHLSRHSRPPRHLWNPPPTVRAV